MSPASENDSKIIESIHDSNVSSVNLGLNSSSGNEHTETSSDVQQINNLWEDVLRWQNERNDDEHDGVDSFTSQVHSSQLIILGSEHDGKKSLLKCLQETPPAKMPPMAKTVSSGPLNFTCVDLKVTASESKNHILQVNSVSMGVWCFNICNPFMTSRMTELALSSGRRTIVLLVVDISRPFQMFSHLQDSIRLIPAHVKDIVSIAVVVTKSDLCEQTARQVLSGRHELTVDYLNFVQYHIRKFALQSEYIQQFD